MDGGLKPIGPEDHDLSSLTPDQSEDLVFLLAQAENAAVVPVRAKDHGLDARLPGDHGRSTVRGWQAKRYTGRVNWSECENSIRRARAFWQPRAITFCFPRDLSAGEQGQFKERLIDQFPEVKLDFWGEKELKRRMRDSEEGRRATRFLFGDPSADLEALRRAAALGGELNSGQQALARLGITHRFLQRDPHFHYGVSTRDSDAPKPEPPPGTLLSVEFSDQDSIVRLDASERYEGAGQHHGLAGAIVFEDEESARENRRELARIQREGGSTTLGPGAAIRVDRVPEGVAEFFPDVIEGLIQVTALSRDRRSVVRSVPILVGAGQAELVIDFASTDPPAGWKDALLGSTGGLDITILVRDSKSGDGRLEAKIDWQHKYGVGTTMEQLVALELVHAAYRGEPIQFVSVQANAPLGNAESAESVAGPAMEDVEGRLGLLAWLAEIEAWTGRAFRPPGEWAQDDAEALAAAIPWVREPFREDVKDIRVSFTYKPEAMPRDPDEAHQFAMTQDLEIDLFGERVLLGRRMLHLPRGCMVEIDSKKNSAVVVPADGTTGTVRLFPPGDPTPFDEEPTAPH